MKNINFKINITTLIIIGVVMFIIIWGGLNRHFTKINNLNNKIIEEVKLRNALTDSMKTYVNERNELVNEKLTLQADLSDLKKINDNLTQSQKNLIKRIDNLDNDKKIITAALIDANILIDSLLHTGVTIIDDNNTTITFSDKQEYIEYNIEVTNVIQSDTSKNSNLFIRKLTLPNEMFVEFHWELNKREKYPVGFSVTNTNPMYKIHDIESYAIPQLDKEDLEPNTWEKINKWFEEKGGTAIKIGIAGTVGFIIGRSL